jgi:hypothetical protein
MGGFVLQHKHQIQFQNVPLAWTTRFEFFTTDLEQFPLMYVHRMINCQSDKKRVFGFALGAKIGEQAEGLCEIIVDFLCNLEQGDKEVDEILREEISNRLGIANKVEYRDLKQITENCPKNLPLLENIWEIGIEEVFGNSIPHGKLYDEIFGIIRFSASGNAPRLGKTSELRMLYWYMKDIGEEVNISGNLNNYNFCEFYLLPSMQELRDEDLSFFPRFRKYYDAIKAFWELEYTETFRINENKRKLVSELKTELNELGHSDVGKKKDLVERLNNDPKYINNTKYRYAKSGTLPREGKDFEERYREKLPEYYDEINQLRQIFNRMPSRFYGYVWNMMTFVETKYVEFSKREALRDFQRFHHNKKGSSSKVLACILQQCFGFEALPIDTWVKTFIQYPLALNVYSDGKSKNPSKEDVEKLYESFNNLDKLEKLIWVSSMGNKTNKTNFESILWCQRYGTDKIDKGPCRGVNPLSCSQCKIREKCPGFEQISEDIVVIEDDRLSLTTVLGRKVGAYDELVKLSVSDLKKLCVSHGLKKSGRKSELISRLQNKPSRKIFAIETNDQTPRKVMVNGKKKGFDIKEIDGHTGLHISSKIKVEKGEYLVKDFVSMFDS